MSKATTLTTAEAPNELQLIKKLSRLAKTSWSPTLRANSHLFAIREKELRASGTPVRMKPAK